LKQLRFAVKKIISQVLMFTFLVTVFTLNRLQSILKFCGYNYP